MKRIACLIAITVWLAGIGFAGWKTTAFSTRTGRGSEPPTDWPTQCKLMGDPQLPMLLVFIHPKCPCTRATLRELDRLLAGNTAKANVYALFMLPEEFPESWAQTDLWDYAQQIPGLSVVVDGGEYRNQFRVSTSGETVLYGSNRKLLFHGGITPGRGHEGDNAGRDAIESWLSREPGVRDTTPVFGCALSSGTADGEEVP